MHTRLSLIVLIALSSVTSSAQVESPKNIVDAVKFLSIDAPDELKSKLISTNDDSLLYIIPPYSSIINYWVIAKWFRAIKDSSDIIKYFASKHIAFYDHQIQIMLLAFKQYLNHNSLDLEPVFKKYSDIETKWYLEYANRFSLDTIQGVYIPKDINECIVHFEKRWSDSLKLVVKKKQESKFVSDAHLAVGMWMRNNWWLWKGSRLSNYFNDLGVNHPDDMSSIILTCYHRYLNGKQFNIKAQVDRFKNYWRVVTPPSLEYFPEQAKNYRILDKSLFKNKMKMTDCIQIATNPSTDTIWLYNYHKGWVQSNWNEYYKLIKKKNVERYLDRIYRRRKV